MIAPCKAPEPSTELRGLHRARRLAASVLLRRRTGNAASQPRIVAWKAWLFAAWVVGVAAAYAAHLAGVF